MEGDGWLGTDRTGQIGEEGWNGTDGTGRDRWNVRKHRQIKLHGGDVIVGGMA